MRPTRGPAPADAAARPSVDLAKGREFWSFRPPKKSPPPAVKRADWPRGDIDRFLLAALEARGLAPVADADRPRLLRRVTFDLIGLPPTPEEVDAFLAGRLARRLRQGRRPAARLAPLRRALGAALARRGAVRRVERQDELHLSPRLALPRLGDRRRSTPTSPIDRFVREQIAGDLLPAEDDRKRAEQLIATGFLALGSKAHDAENRGQFVLDVSTSRSRRPRAPSSG